MQREINCLIEEMWDEINRDEKLWGSFTDKQYQEGARRLFEKRSGVITASDIEYFKEKAMQLYFESRVTYLEAIAKGEIPYPQIETDPSQSLPKIGKWTIAKDRQLRILDFVVDNVRLTKSDIMLHNFKPSGRIHWKIIANKWNNSFPELYKNPDTLEKEFRLIAYNNKYRDIRVAYQAVKWSSDAIYEYYHSAGSPVKAFCDIHGVSLDNLLKMNNELLRELRFGRVQYEIFDPIPDKGLPAVTGATALAIAVLLEKDSMNITNPHGIPAPLAEMVIEWGERNQSHG